MDELERRLRASLAARAEDVEPTPELWLEVQERVARRRRMTWVFAAAGAAAAVLIAAIVVPNVLDRVPPGPPEFLETPPTTSSSPSASPTVSAPVSTPTPIGTPTVTPSETATSGPSGPPVVPDRYVTTDGADIVLHMADGQTRTVYARQPGDPSTIVALAVRPAGDRDGDTTIVFLSQGNDQWFLRYLVVYPDTLSGVEQFPTQHDISADARSTATPPVPVWSPDGEHLAWLEESDAGVTLRAIGWSDGPGTGDSANDNTSFVLTDQNGMFATAEDWVWTEGMGTETAGYLFVSAPYDGGGGAHYAYLQRQGDGGIALDRFAPAADGGTFHVDHADSHANDGAAVGPEYELTIAPGGPQDDTLNLELTWSADGDQFGDLPVPDELRQGADPSALWMTARDDAVFLGQGDQAWLITRDSELDQLDGSVRDAAFLPN